MGIFQSRRRARSLPLGHWRRWLHPHPETLQNADRPPRLFTRNAVPLSRRRTRSARSQAGIRRPPRPMGYLTMAAVARPRRLPHPDAMDCGNARQILAPHALQSHSLKRQRAKHRQNLNSQFHKNIPELAQNPARLASREHQFSR